MVDPYFGQIFDFYWPRLDDFQKTFFQAQYLALLESALAEANCAELCEATTNRIDTLTAWIATVSAYTPPPVLP